MKILLSLTALAGILTAPTSVAAQNQKPNVLFIAVDDLRPALGCYGNAIVQTPNLDKLAKKAVRFERGYCQYPLCNPSRTSLLTGRYPTTTKVMDNLINFRDQNPDCQSLPQFFRSQGWVTLRVGKIFHGGIDDQLAWETGGEPLKDRKPRTPDEQAKYTKLSDRWEAVEGKGEKLIDYQTAEKAVALMEKHKAGPFFLAVGFARPHSPLVAPKKYFDLYDPAKIPLPIDFAPRPTISVGMPKEALPMVNGDLFIKRDASKEDAQKMIAAYYACVSHMDAEVGKVLDALERLGLAENTIIVFWGDHGYHLGEKGKWSKHGALFEVTLRVPIMIALPQGKTKGQSSPRPVQLLDLYPTLAELCGVKAPSGLEGHSLAPLLRDPTTAWQHPAISVVQRGKLVGRSVRTERFRYTEWDADGKIAELYDHQTDPHEMRNLVAESGQVSNVATLRKMLKNSVGR